MSAEKWLNDKLTRRSATTSQMYTSSCIVVLHPSPLGLGLVSAATATTASRTKFVVKVRLQEVVVPSHPSEPQKPQTRPHLRTIVASDLRHRVSPSLLS